MANCMSLDRADISSASKEVSRGMSKPTLNDVRKLKRLIEYLMGHRRCRVKYAWQDPQNEFKVFTDSDWAGCTKTRRSTRGGVLMHGKHFVRVGFGRQSAPDIFIEGDAAASNFGAHATVVKQYFTLLQAFGQASHGSFVICI